MWGAIIGDLAGSVYEYGQIKRIKTVEVQEIIPENAFFSDDTILTIAILDAIEHNRDYESYLRAYGNRYLKYKPNFEPYFKSSFGPGFIKWLDGKEQGKSIGNGAMMRISPVGQLFNTEQEVINNSILATMPSHNSEEALKCTRLIALITYYAKSGMSKQEIMEKLNIQIEYIPFEKFNTTCNQTIGNCLYALFSSQSFEESIKKIISYGGDTDTNACIVGGMAEALYGIDEELIEKAKQKIPESFVQVLEKGYQMREKRENDKNEYER